MARKKSDAELIAEFKAGNAESYEELLQRYTVKVYGLASRLTRSQEDAEEVLQDVFVTVFRKIAGFEGKSSFSSWLYRVTVNAAFMKLRKRRREQLQIATEDSVLEEQSTPEFENNVLEGDEVVQRKEMRDALQEAINRLPADYRPVFVLRDVDGLTSREVGKILNLTIPAVKSRLHRSRLMVRRRMSAYLTDHQTRKLPQAGNY